MCQRMLYYLTLIQCTCRLRLGMSRHQPGVGDKSACVVGTTALRTTVLHLVDADTPCQKRCCQILSLPFRLSVSTECAGSKEAAHQRPTKPCAPSRTYPQAGQPRGQGRPRNNRPMQDRRTRPGLSTSSNERPPARDRVSLESAHPGLKASLSQCSHVRHLHTYTFGSQQAGQCNAEAQAPSFDVARSLLLTNEQLMRASHEHSLAEAWAVQRQRPAAYLFDALAPHGECHRHQLRTPALGHLPSKIWVKRRAKIST